MTIWKPTGLLEDYESGGFYCELFGAAKMPAPHTRTVRERIDGLSLAELRRRAQAAEHELFNLGVTFTVYTDREQIDRILPFDVIPRVLSAEEWAMIERGVVQRVTALNRFIEDVYHEQRILRDGVVPAELVLGNANFRPQMQGLKVPFGVYVNICGVDIVRGGDGRFYVLEDNARTPSGVSYVVENRHLTQRAFPDLMRNIGVRSVSNYGQRLVGQLTELAAGIGSGPSVVLLSPGVYNAAYFEHVFLAREMGVPLVEGRDLVVRDDRVFMKTTGGLARVDVIYRRIDDDFLDPEAFNPTSMLGVRGLMRAYRAGNVVLANAVGTGISDDKAVYAYVPRIIRYYLDEEAILPNVETHICREREGLEYTLRHLEELVVKPVGESGGYGILIGPHASRKALAEFRRRLRAAPANYISQPVVQLSVCPTMTRSGIEPRHVDLRPFAVTGRSTWVLPGGLTRVALRKGSLVVNSSQGGGSKDTWVLE
jgi:uncharacterized circularly permuted ATP-grasp superfamily protein